jgi:bifunctional non-homologous end joining protein LigD
VKRGGRRAAIFYAFDVLSLNGEDVTPLPLLERKGILISILPKIHTGLLHLDHVAAARP